MPNQSATAFHKIWYNLYEELYKHLPTETLSQRIRKARLSANMSTSDLASLVGVRKSTITDYENNVSLPSANVMRKLVDVFSVESICGDDEYLIFIVSDFPKALHSWREKINYSYREAAKVLGIHCSNFESWEKGEFTPSRKSFELIKELTKI